MFELQKNEIGSTIRAVLRRSDGSIFDVSTATVKQLIFRKPTSEKLTKTASFYTDGSDGKIQYITIAGDLDTIGVWTIQGYIELASGEVWKSRVEFMRVLDNL